MDSKCRQKYGMTEHEERFTKYLTVILRQHSSQDYCTAMLRHSYDSCKINNTLS